MKRFASICLTIFLAVSITFADAGTYYNAINTSSPTFVTQLTGLINPHTKVAYDSYDETILKDFETKTDATGKYVECVYSSHKYYFTGTFAWGLFSREHTFCHSWMPSNPGESAPEYCDQHHLFPTHQNNANGRRSNHPLGVVVNATYTYLDGKLGTDANGDVVYEPRDAQKGDAVRAMMYMMVCYNGSGGYNWTLGYLNGTTLPGKSEGPQSQELLKAWHAADPPDAWEIGRNEYIFTKQGNRNPFVDHPEYVALIDFNTLTPLAPVTFAIEPSNYVTSFSSGTTTSSSIQVTWTDAAAGTQAPSGYLVMVNTTGVFTSPVDGFAITDDTNIADGSGAMNVPFAAADLTSFTGLSSSTPYYFRIYSYNTTGGSINYKTDGAIPSVTVSTPAVALAAEPANHVTAFASGTTTSSSVPLTWTDAVAGAQAPSGYLLMANKTGVFTTPADGAAVGNDTNLADGSAAVNIGYAAADAYTFSGLTASTTYYFQLVPYNTVGGAINYNTSATIPAVSAATPAGSGTLVPGLFTGIYTFTGAASDGSVGDDVYNGATEQPPFGTFTIMSRSGVTAEAAGNVFNSKGWGAGTARDESKYVSFALTLNEGYAFQNLPLALAFDTRRSGTGPTSGEVQYRYGAAGTFSSTGIYALSGTSVIGKSLSIPAPGDATSSVLEIRFYGFGTSTALTGTLRFDNVKLTTPKEPELPVELTAFTAQPRGGSVVLRWTTATEVNNYGFAIERCAIAAGQPSGQWMTIGFVDGAGTSNTAHQYSFVDAPVGAAAYRLKQLDRDGSFSYSPVVETEWTAVTSGFALGQNYPNPFNPSTVIQYQTTENARVTLGVYDALGREVASLVNDTKPAGAHSVEWNASALPSGVYLYRLTAGTHSTVKRMVLQK